MFYGDANKFLLLLHSANDAPCTLTPSAGVTRDHVTTEGVLTSLPQG